MLPSWAWVLFAAPFAGSFLGLLAARLPVGRPVVLARSACDHCGAMLGATQLVPLVSYALQRGRCRHCRGAISAWHMIMELGCLGIAVWGAMLVSGPTLYAACLLGWMLLALAVCDWRSFLLPDAMTLPLLLLGLISTEWLSPADLLDHGIAVILGYGIFRGVSLAYRRFRGKEGLGQGDAKLLAAGGAWAGLSALPAIMLVSALGGLALAAALRLTGKSVRHDTVLPFGPALALGIWLVWLYHL
ncbi:prepilin peptidase [Acidisoma cellulosilytica]|uniref:Prepilin leader peptidase/N-methyltransferase n=1 Tax=Acidisoma cellulosilyticum TaxID=2802395 RepID=A0A963Z2T8_9PROT|nr:prepilin peptidase [Acidisoma cellulosilyticum]